MAVEGINRARADWLIGAALFAFLTAIYSGAGALLPIRDAYENCLTAESLLDDGDWLFTRQENPDMFRWLVVSGQRSEPVTVDALDDSLNELIGRGVLKPAAVDYVARPSRKPGYYANTFGIGAGVTALPVFAVLRLVYGPLTQRPELLWRAGRLAAALCVAGSAAMIYFTARVYLDRLASLTLALAYGLGTCVWSTSSQALWQHGPNELYLAAGVLAICWPSKSPWWAALAGAMFSAATWCRPTSAVVALCVAVYFLWIDRRRLAAYLLAAAPLAAAMLAYNYITFGALVAFGQNQLGELALSKTGAAQVWQFHPVRSAVGMLISPSRGLFVFSPFLVFSLWGAWRAWRDPRYVPLRVVAAAVGGVWLIEFAHFDWWSGWSYGYRHIVDTATLLVPLCVPAWSQIWRWPTRAVFLTLVAYSIAVQALGSVAYDLSGWNAREGVEIVEGTRRPTSMNIDLPEYRYRLWSLRDNQIAYYLFHFKAARESRRRWHGQACRDVATRLADTHRSVDTALAELNAAPATAGDARSPGDG